MHIKDKTDNRLVLLDNQSDKIAGVGLISVVLCVAVAVFAWNGFWIPAIVLPVIIPCAFLYVKMTRIESTVTFDRSGDSIELRVRSRKGSEVWHWKLSDLETAEVAETARKDTSSGNSRPDLVMKDGTRVPMRPYFAAGSQSWHAVAAVKLFLGQSLDQAPVGWLPPDEFDRFFKDEMERLHR